MKLSTFESIVLESDVTFKKAKILGIRRQSKDWFDKECKQAKADSRKKLK